MKKTLFSLVTAAIALGFGLFASQPVSAQLGRQDTTGSQCQVSGDYGAISVEGNTVTGTFSMSGPENCGETEVSIAVWVCTPAGCNADLQNQRFHKANSDFFDYSDTNGYNRAHPVASISTTLPITLQSGDGCQIQVDLVRGDERADPDHPYPDGPFYDERRMLAGIFDNPACEDEQPQMITVCDKQEAQIAQITMKELNANPNRYGTARPIDPACLPEGQLLVCDPAISEVVPVSPEEQDNYLPADAVECDKPVDVPVCDADAREVITVPSNERDDYLPYDADECKDSAKVPVCNADTRKVIVVNEEDADKYEDKNSSKCKEKPADNPSELPNTGAGASLIAIPTLGGAISAFVRSRNGLLDAFLNK